MNSSGTPDPKAVPASAGAMDGGDSEMAGHDDAASESSDLRAVEAANVDPASTPTPAATPESDLSEPDGPSASATTESVVPESAPSKRKSKARSRSGMEPNNVRKLRQEAMMSKAELARRAGVSPLTINRVESGSPCRMDTKRKILEALGLKPSARAEVWPDIDAQS